MTAYTWIGTTPGDYDAPSNWSPSSGAPTAAGDAALIGPGAQVALSGTLGAVTVALTAETPSGTTGTPPRLGLADASLQDTVIETTNSLAYGADSAALPIAGTVVNAGTIAEAPPQGYGGSLVLDLADGATLVNAGTIAGSAFGTLAIQGSAPASFVNNGVVAASGTSIGIDEPISGNGQIELLRGANVGSHWGSQSTLVAAGAIGAGQTVSMQGALLRLDQPLAFQGTIDATQVLPASSGAPENTIQLPGIDATSDNVAGNVLYVYSGSALAAKIAIDPEIAGDDFALSVGTLYQLGGTGTAISILPPPSPGDGDTTTPQQTPAPVQADDAAAQQDSAGPIAVFDGTAGRQLTVAPSPFPDQAGGLREQYVNLTSDNLSISVSTPGWFIDTGNGNNLVAASSGTNVLATGSGSNFLSGGSGTDIFFIDDSNPSSAVWNTLDNFTSGDSAAIIGVSPADFAISWADGQGLPGFTGLSMHAVAPGKPAVSLTLPGYSTTDLQNGRLAYAFGTDPANGSPFMVVHAA